MSSRQSRSFLLYDVQMDNHILKELPSAIQMVWSPGWWSEIHLPNIRRFKQRNSLSWLNVFKPWVIDISPSHLNLLGVVRSWLKLLIHYLRSLLFCREVLVDSVSFRNLVIMEAKLLEVLHFMSAKSLFLANKVHTEALIAVFFSWLSTELHDPTSYDSALGSSLEIFPFSMVSISLVNESI